MLVDVAVNGPCCSGCGACAEVAPELFALDDFGTAYPVRNPCPEELACQAARICPVSCIEVMVPGTSATPACR